MIRIERSFPAPKSLAIEAGKSDGKYNLVDVTEQLRRDFHNKCYILMITPVQADNLSFLDIRTVCFTSSSLVVGR